MFVYQNEKTREHTSAYSSLQVGASSSRIGWAVSSIDRHIGGGGSGSHRDGRSQSQSHITHNDGACSVRVSADRHTRIPNRSSRSGGCTTNWPHIDGSSSRIKLGSIDSPVSGDRGSDCPPSGGCRSILPFTSSPYDGDRSTNGVGYVCCGLGGLPGVQHIASAHRRRVVSGDSTDSRINGRINSHTRIPSRSAGRTGDGDAGRVISGDSRNSDASSRLARRAQKLAPERGVSDEEKVLRRFSSSFPKPGGPPRVPSYQTQRSMRGNPAPIARP